MNVITLTKVLHMPRWWKKEKQESGASGLPQVVGLTASPGAEDNPNLEMDNTIDHLISLCALMDARSGIKHGC